MGTKPDRFDALALGSLRVVKSRQDRHSGAHFVTPAKAGVQNYLKILDIGVRRYDGTRSEPSAK